MGGSNDRTGKAATTALAWVERLSISRGHLARADMRKEGVAEPS